MSELSEGSARLLRDARELLGPEPDTLSNMGRALEAKLQAGAGLSCGDLEPAHFSGKEHTARAWRSLFGTRMIGVAVGLLALGGTAYFGLSAREVAQRTRRADVPQPSAAEAIGGSVGAAPESRLGPPSDRVEAAPLPALLPSSRAQGPSAAPRGAARKRNPHAAARVAAALRAPALERLRESGAATTPAVNTGESFGARNVAIRPSHGAEESTANSGMIQVALESSNDAAAHSANEHNVNPRAASVVQVSPERDLLVHEVAMIEGAHAALERGDEARALVILDAHAREFPGGTLAEERLALRARALCASGRFDAGREAVRRLAARARSRPTCGTASRSVAARSELTRPCWRVERGTRQGSPVSTSRFICSATRVRSVLVRSLLGFTFYPAAPRLPDTCRYATLSMYIH